MKAQELIDIIDEGKITKADLVDVLRDVSRDKNLAFYGEDGDKVFINIRQGDYHVHHDKGIGAQPKRFVSTDMMDVVNYVLDIKPID